MPTVSFIKIYGPPILKAIRELEKIAVDMPEVRLMDTIIMQADNYEDLISDPQSYFSSIPVEVEIERTGNIISDSGIRLGDHDFYFEWVTEPSMEQINNLIEKIDNALAPLECKYTITTKK